jgi:hypothetical protein
MASLPQCAASTARDQLRRWSTSCPPVGGAHGYAEVLEAITDPSHEEHDSYLSGSVAGSIPLDSI